MNAKPTATVACPKCGRKPPMRTPGESIYFCPHCNAQFDDQPDEGGTYSDRDPSARLEREERQQQQRRGRRA